MKLPDYLKLVALLNATETRQQALDTLVAEGGPDRSSETLRALLPYLSLPTLLSLREPDSRYSRALGPLITETLYDLLDAQWDWVVSPGCPISFRDSYYLVRVFGPEWDRLIVNGMDSAAESQRDVIAEGMVLDLAEDDYEKVPDASEEGACVSLKAFRDDLARSTGGLLAQVDWSNVVLGGGAVLSILTGKVDCEAYSTSDLDLFLYGLEPDELIPKVASLIDQIQAALPGRTRRYKEDVLTRDARFANIRTRKWAEDNDLDWKKAHKEELLVIKGESSSRLTSDSVRLGFNAITIVPPLSVSPRRTVQIILQSHASVFDALAWFDLDACAVGYTGKAVIAVPRAVRSLSLGNWTGGVNLLDPRLARKGDPSGTMLAVRAVKYLARGFSLAVPPAALVAIEPELEHPFAVLVRKARRRAKQEFFAKDTHENLKVFPANGLDGLLRREQRFLSQLAKKQRAAATVSDDDDASSSADESDGSGHWSEEYDYGSRRARWIKRIGDQDLKRRENTDVFQDFWLYNIKHLDDAICGLVWEVNHNKGVLDLDEISHSKTPYSRYGNYGSCSQAKPAEPMTPTLKFGLFRELAVPYVTSFDAGNAIGLLETRVKAPPTSNAEAKRKTVKEVRATYMGDDNDDDEEEDDEEEDEDEDAGEAMEEGEEGNVEGPDWPVDLSLRETALSFQILEALSLEARRVQYVVQLPRSVLPLFDVADRKMKALLHRLLNSTCNESAAAAKEELVIYELPAFFPEVESTVDKTVMKLEPACEMTAPSASDVHATPIEPIRPFIPDCFPGPIRRGEKIQLSAFKKTAADLAEDRHLLSPLSPTGDSTTIPENLSSKFVYRVATLAGLWQFKGLDPDIDKALDLL
ncbi:hypothetical protein JCM3774_005458 [Rhodotorula dairenensis]